MSHKGIVNYVKIEYLKSEKDLQSLGQVCKVRNRDIWEKLKMETFSQISPRELNALL